MVVGLSKVCCIAFDRRLGSAKALPLAVVYERLRSGHFVVLAREIGGYYIGKRFDSA